MSSLAKEVNNIQNPAIGAYLQWCFAKGFHDGHKTKGFPSMPLLFLVLPAILHRQTFELIKSTQRTSGLKAFSGKFGKSSISQRDVLLSLQPRVIQWREFSWESIYVALTTNLFVLELDGTLLPVSQELPKPKILNPIKHLANESNKLGFWCGQLPLEEIALLLHIQF